MAMSGPAFRALIGKFISFHTEQLFDPHWGGRIAFPTLRNAVGWDGVVWSRQGGGAGGVVAVSRLDRRRAKGLPAGWQTNDRGHAGAQVVGRRVSQEIRRRLDRKRPAARGDYPGVSGYASDVADARAEAAIIANAMGELREVAPESAASVSESNSFEKDWQRSYWRKNYERLRAIKRQYDPDGLFYVHHGVGSEDWSNDGFVRHAAN